MLIFKGKTHCSMMLSAKTFSTSIPSGKLPEIYLNGRILYKKSSVTWQFGLVAMR